MWHEILSLKTVKNNLRQQKQEFTFAIFIASVCIASEQRVVNGLEIPCFENARTGFFQIELHASWTSERDDLE